MAKRGDKFLAKSFISHIPEQLVIFEGIQKVGIAEYPDFPIYTLTKSFGKHVEGSTLARNTLESYGYILESKAP